jgi:hypothetical protein
MHPFSAVPLPFFGYRRLQAARVAPAVSAFLGAAAAAGCVPAAGCAGGVSAALRWLAPAFGLKPIWFAPPSSAPSALVARSVALVRFAASVPGPARAPVPARAIGFVSGACPGGISPAASWRSGIVPSGTWSELALSFGLGLSLCVVWCTPDPVALPAWGAWQPCPLTLPLPAFVLSPPPQLSLGENHMIDLTHIPPLLAARIKKAEDIANSPGQIIMSASGHYVHSQSMEGKTYYVDRWTGCNCPDALARTNLLIGTEGPRPACKHQMAVWIASNWTPRPMPYPSHRPPTQGAPEGVQP